MSAPIQELKLNLQVAIQRAARKSVKNQYLQSSTTRSYLSWSVDHERVVEDVWNDEQVMEALDAFVKRDTELRLEQVKQEVKQQQRHNYGNDNL